VGENGWGGERTIGEEGCGGKMSNEMLCEVNERELRNGCERGDGNWDRNSL
jgi:hypothetical protein